MSQSKRIEPGPGQESVWDYPRPPRLEATPKRVRVIFNGIVIAESSRALRILETSHPPTYYIPPEEVRREYLSITQHRSSCEFKGQASYYTLSVRGQISPDAAWFYPAPSPAFIGLKNYIAFYSNRVDACFVGDERVQAQIGDYYGGWITNEIVGPFKGGPGTMGW
jgi:uncharacterized protein (DUF427 family)